MQDSVGGHALATFALCAGAICALLRTKAYAANKDMVQSCFLYSSAEGAEMSISKGCLPLEHLDE